MSLLRHAKIIGFCALVAIALPSCGFQPLHGPTASGQNLDDVLKSVEISTVPGRVGQRIRNELIYGTMGGERYGDVKPAFRLDLIVKEELRNTLIAQTGDPQGRIVEVNVEFKLVRLADNKTVFTGRTAGRAAYDKVPSVFADVRAQVDAENRAARTIAENIKLRVSAYLSGNA